jgi:hypothetical protein
MRAELLAECDGVPAAAIAVSGGVVVADPGEPPARVLKFLRYEVIREAGRTGAARSRFRRNRPRLRRCTPGRRPISPTDRDTGG